MKRLFPVLFAIAAFAPALAQSASLVGRWSARMPYAGGANAIFFVTFDETGTYAEQISVPGTPATFVNYTGTWTMPADGTLITTARACDVAPCQNINQPISLTISFPSASEMTSFDGITRLTWVRQ